MLKQHPAIDWVIHLRHTVSTMIEAENMLHTIQSLPESILIVADEQSGGIGRNNNKWVSPMGGLWFTLMLKTYDIHPQISLLLGLSLHESILKLYPGLENDLAIKWPNDILFRGKKLAGILAKSQHQYLCAGIGVNTNVQVLPDNLNLLPTSLERELAFPVSNAAILSTFLSDFNLRFSTYQETGMTHFIPEINSRLFGMGKKIAFDKGIQIVCGTFRGLNGDGALLLENENGHITQNYSGSIIRFDVELFP